MSRSCYDAGTLNGFRHIDFTAEELAQTPPAQEEGLTAAHAAMTDHHTVKNIKEFLTQEHEKPFVLAADLDNPHDICFWIGDHKGRHKDPPTARELPPLPDNFELEDIHLRPASIQRLCCANSRIGQAARWTDDNFRHYLAAYYRYVEIVDKQIGEILGVLHQSTHKDNTAIVFFADHGEGMAAHRQVTKGTAFYEETTRVPLILSGFDNTKPGIQIEDVPVTLADVFPTLCEAAGLFVPDTIYGKSLYPLLTGRKQDLGRDFIISQWGSTGRMLRSRRFKYIRYCDGGDEEFYDLREDPGEKKTLIHEDSYKKDLDEHRISFKNYLENTDDPFLSVKRVPSGNMPSHPLGYQNHPQP